MSDAAKEVGRVIDMAFKKIKEEGYLLEDGDAFVCEGKNFCLIIELEGGHLRTEVVGGKALKLEAALSIYGESEADHAVETVPVVHGEWIDDECSVCGCGAPDEGYWNSPFCPNCGADMRKKVE